jgi:hypothetical protein
MGSLCIKVKSSIPISPTFLGFTVSPKPPMLRKKSSYDINNRCLLENLD